MPCDFKMIVYPDKEEEYTLCIKVNDIALRNNKNVIAYIKEIECIIAKELSKTRIIRAF